MLPVDEALGLILDHAAPLGVESVGLAAAEGRILAVPVRADRDAPPFPKSSVDGYAARSADLVSGRDGEPVRLRVLGTVPAGATPRMTVGPGEAAEVMTGAPIPKGADAVVMVEDVEPDVRAGREVRIPRRGRPTPPVAPGTGIVPRGAETTRGTVLLEPGLRLGAAAVGVLAATGTTRVRVGRRPRVAVLSTGDELRHPSARDPGPAAIRDANSHAVAARCRALGAPTRRLGFVRDDPSRLRSAIATGLESDVLLVSGGVSRGRFDFVEDVLTALGVRRLVTSVAIRPGKPLVFGVRDAPRRALVFGLPGNPVSALVTLEVFVRPALARLSGAPPAPRPLLEARLEAAVANPGPRRAHLPARVGLSVDGALTARPIRFRGSGDIAALALANALLVVPEDVSGLSVGDRARVLPLDADPDGPGASWQDPRTR